MRLKILGFICVCLLLFVSSGSKFNYAKAEAIIQEDPEMVRQKKTNNDHERDCSHNDSSCRLCYR